MVLPSGWEAYVGFYAGALFVALIGAVTKSEMRTMLLGLVCVVAAPNPASLFVAGILALLVRPLSGLLHG